MSNDPAFKAFESLAWGYRAMFVLLHTYRVKHNCRTLREMISRWAPPSENHTENYIKAVSSWAGMAPDREIDTKDKVTMIRMVKAMSTVENGVSAQLSDVQAGWELLVKYPV